MTYDLKDLEKRMKGAIEVLTKEFSGLRTGRASTSLLEPLQVEVYGSMMPLSAVGTVNVPEPRMLSVQVWDMNNVSAVAKAIRDSDLNLNPATDGQVIRVPLPDLTEERRRELQKVAGQYAEQARIAVRNIRRDGMDSLKKAEKDGDMSKDEAHSSGDDVQKLTDKYIAQVDSALEDKQADIMKV